MAKIPKIAFIVIGIIIAAASAFFNFVLQERAFVFFMVAGVGLIIYGFIKRTPSKPKAAKKHLHHEKKSYFHQGMKYCSQCGSALHPYDRFCKHCGARLK